jgi:Fe-S-cluster-containing dehydrogenase component/DMSO reductase anchor subunit
MSEVTLRNSVAELSSEAPPTAESGTTRRRLPLLDVERAIAQQRQLTAVEHFALRAAELETRDVYRDLIPLSAPARGEQYAFEVDLDACTGCKACVAACHTLNGLDPGETFRSVGLLVGGGAANGPRIQTVTSSCHHCLDPACLNGCPVSAYEKDAVTGIVRHLDDQCFGCQYCTLMCPYDAPKYNEAKGIVRKCDMCSDRLLHGEAPACVQACPNEAIAIRVVEHSQVVAAADARHFVRGAADRDVTLPTTSYKTVRATPDNLLPVDYYRTPTSEPHLPLVFMLTLSQWSVGAWCVRSLCEPALGQGRIALLENVALAVVLAAALGASLLHLGRPWLAWRAVLGVRSSWLSREVLAFGALFKLVLLQIALTALPRLPAFMRGLGPVISQLISICGLAAVFCSVMVYAATRREHWSFERTALRFFGSTALLGTASALVFAGFAGSALTGELWRALLLIALGRSALEGWLLLDARARQLSPRTRMARLMLGELWRVTYLRAALLAVGGLLIPTIALVSGVAGSPLLALGVCLVLVAAELCERYLFFAAAPSLRMPGSLR